MNEMGLNNMPPFPTNNLQGEGEEEKKKRKHFPLAIVEEARNSFSIINEISSRE